MKDLSNDHLFSFKKFSRVVVNNDDIRIYDLRSLEGLIVADWKDLVKIT